VPGEHGPNDLRSMHPEVRAAIDAAIGRILAAGKAPGVLTVDEGLARHYIDIGARFVAVGVDETLLARATRALAVALRASPAATPSAAGY
jgi:4-hydroxy-2-oxoheptanedioate aldolase